MFVFVGAGVSPAEASPTDEDGGDSSSERSSPAGEMASKAFLYYLVEVVWYP